MTFATSALKGAVLAAAMLVACVLAAAPAWAHVKVTADHSWRGGVAILTFSVPNESETGSPTTQLSVALPNVTSAHTEVMPGWTATLDHDIPAGVFRSVTWTAAPNAGFQPISSPCFASRWRGDTSLPPPQRFTDPGGCAAPDWRIPTRTSNISCKPIRAPSPGRRRPEVSARGVWDLAGVDERA